MHEAYVALGTNMGDREAALRDALRRLDGDADIALCRISAVYETAPVGYTDQPAFLNMAVCVETGLEPLALLRKLLAIEQEMGRVRDIRWGPRNIDLDLLVHGETKLETPELTLPHPRMGERAFVLVPLKDIWPANRSFPWNGPHSAASLEQEGIARWAEWNGLGL